MEEGSKVGEGNEVTVIGYHSVVLEDAVVEDGAMIYQESILHKGGRNYGKSNARTYKCRRRKNKSS